VSLLAAVHGLRPGQVEARLPRLKAYRAACTWRRDAAVARAVRAVQTQPYAAWAPWIQGALGAAMDGAKVPAKAVAKRLRAALWLPWDGVASYDPAVSTPWNPTRDAPTQPLALRGPSPSKPLPSASHGAARKGQRTTGAPGEGGPVMPWDPATYDRVVRLVNAHLQAFPTPGRSPEIPRLATLNAPSTEALTHALTALARPLVPFGPTASGRGPRKGEGPGAPEGPKAGRGPEGGEGQGPSDAQRGLARWFRWVDGTMNLAWRPARVPREADAQARRDPLYAEVRRAWGGLVHAWGGLVGLRATYDALYAHQTAIQRALTGFLALDAGTRPAVARLLRRRLEALRAATEAYDALTQGHVRLGSLPSPSGAGGPVGQGDPEGAPRRGGDRPGRPAALDLEVTAARGILQGWMPPEAFPGVRDPFRGPVLNPGEAAFLARAAHALARAAEAARRGVPRLPPRGARAAPSPSPSPSPSGPERGEGEGKGKGKGEREGREAPEGVGALQLPHPGPFEGPEGARGFPQPKRVSRVPRPVSLGSPRMGSPPPQALMARIQGPRDRPPEGPSEG